MKILRRSGAHCAGTFNKKIHVAHNPFPINFMHYTARYGTVRRGLHRIHSLQQKFQKAQMISLIASELPNTLTKSHTSHTSNSVIKAHKRQPIISGILFVA